MVTGVLTRGAQVLMCHRRADRAWYPDVWDFPGGHLEDGETPEEALVRELREELGIEAQVDGAVMARWVADDHSEDITFLAVSRWEGELVNLAPDEHDDIGWFTLAETQSLRLPDPRYGPLLEDLLGPGSDATADDPSR